MNFRYITLSVLALMCFFEPKLKAQESDTSMLDDEMMVKKESFKKFYWSNGVDGALFQSSIITRPPSSGLPARSSELSTLRFSYFVNLGFHFNYDLSKGLGLYTGIGIKSIGFIDKVKDSTIKRRVYALGVPLGVKIGSLSKRKFFFAGGGVDLAVNYREKSFMKRGDKEKFNEWFSHRTPQFMPYVFAGISINPGAVLKFQYYPGNFMNTAYAINYGTSITYPYAGYDVHLLVLSLGIDIHYKAGAIKEQKKNGIIKRMM